MKKTNLLILIVFLLAVIFSGCAVNHANSNEDTPRVYIDSVAIPVDSTNDTIIALHPGRVDTLPGKPSKVYGRIYDQFLEKTSNSYAFNGQSEFGGGIAYGRDTITGNELGIKSNNFIISYIDKDWFFTGMNKLHVYSKNIMGNEGVAEAKFYINRNWVADSLTPSEDHDFGLIRQYGNGNIWSDSLDGIIRIGFKLTCWSQINSLCIYFDGEHHIVKADTILDNSDSLVIYYWCNLAREPAEGSHLVIAAFTTKGYIDTIKAGWNIYVDNTKPDINIFQPEAYKKYYPRVDSTMTIVLKTGDDSMQYYFPKADSIIMEIDSIAGNDFVNVFRYKETNGMHLFYGDWYVYKWYYKDNNGHPVPSGEYRFNVSVYDHAGNEKDSYVYFTIDNSPSKLLTKE